MELFWMILLRRGSSNWHWFQELTYKSGNTSVILILIFNNEHVKWKQYVCELDQRPFV